MSRVGRGDAVRVGHRVAEERHHAVRRHPVDAAEVKFPPVAVLAGDDALRPILARSGESRGLEEDPQVLALLPTHDTVAGNVAEKLGRGGAEAGRNKDKN